jgi:hypothetical protein
LLNGIERIITFALLSSDESTNRTGLQEVYKYWGLAPDPSRKVPDMLELVNDFFQRKEMVGFYDVSEFVIFLILKLTSSRYFKDNSLADICKD